jgi:hypothetical protein
VIVPSETPVDEAFLRASLGRALHGNCPATLLRASIEADVSARIVRLLFEYALRPSHETRESCSVAAAEVIADFGVDWSLDERHEAAHADVPPLAIVVHQCVGRDASD